MRPKVPGAIIRERAETLRDRGRLLERQFEVAQAGRLRRGLTLEDGTLVLTDNFLKVRIPPGHARNEWVDVKIAIAESGLTGTVDDRPCSPESWFHSLTRVAADGAAPPAACFDRLSTS